MNLWIDKKTLFCSDHRFNQTHCLANQPPFDTHRSEQSESQVHPLSASLHSLNPSPPATIVVFRMLLTPIFSEH